MSLSQVSKLGSPCTVSAWNSYRPISIIVTALLGELLYKNEIKEGGAIVAACLAESAVVVGPK